MINPNDPTFHPDRYIRGVEKIWRIIEFYSAPNLSID